MFSDALADKEHLFSKHPEDYTLFEIGDFDDQKGRFIMHDANVSIGCALEFISK